MRSQRWFTALLVVLVCAGVAQADEKQKNVLFILVDDLKPRLGTYGDTLAQSPNIDRLAARGLRFDAAYCNQAVCSPSRNAVLTGLRPQTLGIYDLATNFRKSVPDAVTLPQFFKQHGYRSEGLGKTFHVGHGNNQDTASWSVPYYLVRREQQRPNNPASTHYALEASLPPKVENPEKLNRNNRPRGVAYEAADVSDDTYVDGLVAQEAVRRIQNAAKTPEEPFFLAVGFTKPHLPFVAPQKYWDLYDPSQIELPKFTTPPEGAPEFAATKWGELRNYRDIPKQGKLSDELTRTLIHGYLASVSYMDAQVGKVIDALDQSGLAENTVIVLWGDHGWHLGDHGFWCKHSNYEQATRIPVLFVAPGVTQPKTSTTAFLESVDIYPTLAELAQLPAPEGIDGLSQVPVLKSPESKVRTAAIQVYPREKRIGRSLRTDRYRLVEWKVPGEADSDAVFELYDYQADPDETKNLAESQPEVVAKLLQVLKTYPEAKPQI